MSDAKTPNPVEKYANDPIQPGTKTTSSATQPSKSGRDNTPAEKADGLKNKDSYKEGVDVSAEGTFPSSDPPASHMSTGA